MTLAERFLDLLEQKDWVGKEVVERLRRQVASSPQPISPQVLAEQLLRAGHLTSHQVQRLLGQLQQALEADSGQGKPSSKEPAKASKGPEAPEAFASFLEEELGLAPLEEEVGPPGPKPPRPAEPTPSSGGQKPKSPGALRGTLPAGKQPEQSPPSAGPQAELPPDNRPGGAKGPPAKPAPPQQPPPASASKKRAPAAGSKPPEESSPLASLLEEEFATLEREGAAGGLEALLAEAAAEPAGLLGPLGAAPAKRSVWARLFGLSARRSARRWDSPVILIGSGALLILLLVGMVLILVVRRESGDQLLEAAHKDFNDGAYTQAIFKYNQFLDRFGSHPRASLARVRRGIAQLRQLVEEGRDWPKAFQRAQQVLEEIAGEEAFRDAHVHLSSLLPRIAQGLASLAEKQSDSRLLSLAEQTLEFLDRYVPRSLHNRVEVEEIQGLLGQLHRRFNEQAETEKAVSAIRACVQANRPAEGYQLARSLLRQYPRAADREIFQQVRAALKDSFRKQLARSEPNRLAQSEELDLPIQEEIPLGAVYGQPIAGLENQVAVVYINGCLYGLEAATGKLLWRKWTGPLSTGRAPDPQPLSLQPDAQSDLIALGASRKELWRLDRASGHLRWRNLLPGPAAAPPVLAENSLLVISELPEARSRLEWIDPQTGTAIRAVDFPQKIQVAPAIDLRKDRIYLIGEHSYIWVLSFSDGQCVEVIDLGHAPGNITARPMVVADWLLVCENHRLERARLKLISVEQASPTGSGVVFEEEIPGHIDTQPIALDRRLIVLSDRGAIRVYEIQASEGKSPLARVAHRGPEGPTHLARFGLLRGEQLWVAGFGLDRFEVQSAQGRLEFQPLAEPDPGDIFLQPPIGLNGTVVHVRYRPGMPGVWVAAVDCQTGQRRWQTQLAVPPVGEPIPQANPPENLWIIRQTGEIFETDLRSRKSRLLAPSPLWPPEKSKQTAQRAAGRPEESQARFLISEDGNLLILSSPPTDRWFVLERKTGPAGWKPVVLRGTISNWPSLFANGLLVPRPTGRIELRHPRTGEELMAPFQPPLEPGRMPQWSQPMVIASRARAPSAQLDNQPPQPPPIRKKEDGEPTAEKEVGATAGSEEFLVWDGLGRIYRVGIADNPKPHLKALGWVDLGGQLARPVAVLGANAWVVVEPTPHPLPSASKSPPSSHQSPGQTEMAGNKASPAPQKEASSKTEPFSPSLATAGSKEASLPAGSSLGAPATGGSQLICLRLSDLHPTEIALLPDRCIWGPTAVGQWMILATNRGEYLIGNSQGKIVGKLHLDTAQPVGRPLEWEGGLLVATQSGQLVWIRAEEKEWKADILIHLDHPFASGPVVVGDRGVVLGHDATVYTLAVAELSRRKTVAGKVGKVSSSGGPRLPSGVPSAGKAEKPPSGSLAQAEAQNLPGDKKPASSKEQRQ